MSARTAQPNPTRRPGLLPIAAVIVALAAAATGSARLATASPGAHVSTRAQAATLEMHHLQSAGYIATACTREGTLMVNPKTHRRTTVRYA